MNPRCKSSKQAGNRQERWSYSDLSRRARPVYSQFLQFGQGLHRSGESHEAVEVEISGRRRQERTDVRAALPRIAHVQAPLNKLRRRPGLCQQDIPPDGGPACSGGGAQHLQVFDLSMPAGQHFSLIKKAALATQTRRSDRSCPTAANVSEPSGRAESSSFLEIWLVALIVLFFGACPLILNYCLNSILNAHIKRQRSRLGSPSFYHSPSNTRC